MVHELINIREYLRIPQKRMHRTKLLGSFQENYLNLNRACEMFWKYDTMPQYCEMWCQSPLNSPAYLRLNVTQGVFNEAPFFPHTATRMDWLTDIHSIKEVITAVTCMICTATHTADLNLQVSSFYLPCHVESSRLHGSDTSHVIMLYLQSNWVIIRN
jgi:hypothetical protein